MAVRDFVDEQGTKWRVWPVLRSSIHPKTAAEDYLGEYGDGWLCFESGGDGERRRLARYPEDWERMTDKELCRLLERAAVVPVRGKHTPPKPGDSVTP
jgi:hypothetical protein